MEVNNLFSSLFGRAYDAVKSGTRRKTNPTNLRAEDKLLARLDRDKLVSNARNLNRNHAIAAYAIRKHLDYVSTFNFQCRSAYPELNREVERLMRWYMRAFNCDVSYRYDFPELTRMFERLAVTDGDVFVYKLADGHVQVVEGDRVRTPTDLGEFKDKITSEELAKYVHGIKADGNHRHESYLICERTDAGGFVLIDIVKASDAFHHTYADRFDQLRGVSPLSAAMNAYFDIGEAQEYALAKMKLSQLFVLKVSRSGGGGSESDATFEFGNGPQIIDLNKEEGEDADFLESNTPSTEFQAFMETMISNALKALDIPYSFYNESFTNYSGARQALLLYEQSCESKRKRLQKLLNNITVWRLGLFIADGILELPDGMFMSDLDFEWIPAGIPWIDPLKDITADAMAIKAGIKSRQMICKENGDDFQTIADQIANEKVYLEDLGLSTDVENVTVNLTEGDGTDVRTGKR